MIEQLCITPAERADYDSFKARVYMKSGIDLNQADQNYLYGFLTKMVEQYGKRNFAGLYELLSGTSGRWTEFMDLLPTNVGENFWTQECWEALRSETAPKLLQHRVSLSIWCPSCGIGAVPYSLAMLISDQYPGLKYTVLATDIDRVMLDRARKGKFTERDIQNVPNDIRLKFLRPVAPEMWEVAPELRSAITFERHNLLIEDFEQCFDLVACGSVVNSLADAAQDNLYKMFARSLRPTGCLLVGSPGKTINRNALGLDSPAPFCYQRAA